jgi:uroporphyrinogen-III synthase
MDRGFGKRPWADSPLQWPTAIPIIGRFRLISGRLFGGLSVVSHPLLPPNASGVHGKHILITRPAETEAPAGHREGLSQQLIKWGAQVSWLPLVEIQPVPFHLAPLAGFDWLFFTSKNAVNQFFKHTISAKELMALKIAVVGPTTGQCVEAFGANPTFVSPHYNAESAASAFCEKYPACKGMRILWPCGNLANPALQAILEAAGVQVRPLVVYQTILKSQLSHQERAVLQQPVDMLVFTSPSAIEAWVELGKQADINPSQSPVACLGPKTTQAAMKLLGRADVQANPSTLAALAHGIFLYFEEGGPK